MAKHLIICGHGQGPKGYDPGAINPRNKTEEATVVRQVAELMKKYSTDLTVIADKNVYAYKSMQQYKGYDTITELHLNAFNSKAYGTETLIHADYEPDEIDKKIAAFLGKYFYNRGIKKRKDLLNVNLARRAGFNYRLVEICFVDNDNDLAILQKNIEAIAKGLTEAITGKTTSILQQLNQKATVQSIERGGTKTPDTLPKSFKELNIGDIVEVRQQATNYVNGQSINPSVNGQKFLITGKEPVKNQYSKYVYRLAKNNVAIGWVYEHDLVQAWEVPKKDTIELNDNEFTIDGQTYIITRK